MVDRSKMTDSAASIDKDGKISDARLHEQMTDGVDDIDFRLESKRKLLAAGVPKEDLDRLIEDPKKNGAPHMTYTVRVDDNYHYMDEGARYIHGEFATSHRRVTMCKGVPGRSVHGTAQGAVGFLVQRSEVPATPAGSSS